MKKKICMILIAVFVAVLGTSTYFIIDHYKESDKQAELYGELADLVNAAAQTDAATEPAKQIPYSEEKMLLPELAELYQQNGDLVGWISIADTNINYPVMQSVNEPNFYLKHGFDKEYSDYGCPYVQEDCDVQEPSDNLVIYGHHMSNGSMFAHLEKFKNKDFWSEHRMITFNILTDKQEYEIVAVFRTVVYTDSPDAFKYYHFVDAVKTNTDKDNPQEVATMDESKKQILSDIFWEMNSISSRRESHSETEITETDDGNGNIVQTETTVTKTTLYITVSHLTVDEMADLYGFDAEQREYLAELLKDKNNSLWAAVLYGIRYSEDQIVTVALSQVGNVGGEPYWSWYGFGSRVEWCACFVSWCADQCGYIDTGVVPKYAGCVNGVQWFKDRGQWIDGSAEPVPGMIIFFDWDNKGSSGPQDGQSDHTGIVQKVENGIVHTVEGNSGDSCRVNQYSVGHYEILGYGVPNY